MRQRFTRALTIAAVAALAAASPAHAQLPGVTATFLQPSGTGSTTDAFDVWVRLSLAAGSPAIQFDGSSPGTNFGLPGLPGKEPAAIAVSVAAELVGLFAADRTRAAR